MMIYLFTLIVFSSRQLPPPSLRAHLNNYYNPEECKLRGTHSGEKLGPWITHLHFPPRGIQTFILWSHPSFRDSNNEPLLHCNAILAFSFKTDSKWLQISLLLCYFLRLSWIPQEEGIMAMYNDCGENKAWWSWWLWRHLKSPGSSDDHPPTDRKSLGSNWWALISGDTDRGTWSREIQGGRPLLGRLESSHTTVLGLTFISSYSIYTYTVQNK